MGSKDGGGGQPLPTPEEMFAAQAEYNRINQYTPSGSLIFGTDPSGQASATMEYSPDQQAMIDASNQTRINAFSRLNRLLGFGGAPPPSRTPTDITPRPGGNPATVPGTPGAVPRRPTGRVPIGSGAPEWQGTPEGDFYSHYLRNQSNDIPMGYEDFWGMMNAGGDAGGMEGQKFRDLWAQQQGDGSSSISGDMPWGVRQPQVVSKGPFRRVPDESGVDRVDRGDTGVDIIGGGPLIESSPGPPIGGEIDPVTGEPISPEYFTQPPGIGDLGPMLPGSIEELNQFGDAARSAFFERGMGLLRPEQERARQESLEYASNRGLPIGAEVEEYLSDRLARQQGEQQMNLGLESIIRGDQAMQNRLGMISGIRGGNLQERLAELGRGDVEYNRLAGILGLTPTQGPGLSGYFQPGQVDVMNPYAMNQQQSQFQQGQMGNLLGSLLGFGGQLGGMGILASGRRFKKSIVPLSGDDILNKIKNMPIYRWLYKGEADNHSPHIGPLADDFNEAFDNPGIHSSKATDGIDISSLHGLTLAAVQALIKRVEKLEGAK